MAIMIIITIITIITITVDSADNITMDSADITDLEDITMEDLGETNLDSSDKKLDTLVDRIDQRTVVIQQAPTKTSITLSPPSTKRNAHHLFNFCFQTINIFPIDLYRIQWKVKIETDVKEKLF